MIRIERLDSEGLARETEALAGILHACVADGASVGFVWPFTLEMARAFWTGPVAYGVAGGGRHLLVARLDGVVVGTAQLDFAGMPNQRHRADVAKVLVHPTARRRGIARRLMLALEEIARPGGRWLLTLDTRVGDAAQPLYAALGYELAGVIPFYAQAPEDPSRFDGTAYMFKTLAAPR